MSNNRKDAIITFKVDESLAGAMQGLPNRSEFIRSAILGALENTCPTCKGTGMLTLQQRDNSCNMRGSPRCGAPRCMVVAAGMAQRPGLDGGAPDIQTRRAQINGRGAVVGKGTQLVVMARRGHRNNVVQVITGRVKECRVVVLANSQFIPIPCRGNEDVVCISRCRKYVVHRLRVRIASPTVI